MSENDSKVYLMVPRSLTVTFIATAICLFIGIVASFQYANYVDRKSSHELCGVVILSNDLYKALPPDPRLASNVVATINRLRAAMLQLQEDYKCK